MTPDLTTHDLSKPRYIIHTPSGYFIRWSTTDAFAELAPRRDDAARLSSEAADEVARKLKKMGFSCAKIED